MKELVIIGAGGHAAVVIEAARACGEFEVTGVLGLPAEMGASVLGVPVNGTDDDMRKAAERGAEAAIGLGSVGDASGRVRLRELAGHAGLPLAIVVHPSACVSPSASLAEGVFVGPAAVIGPRAVLGACAIVNSGAVVDHDCEVGDFAHVAPGASLSGSVRVGARAHVGTGASVIQGATIGEGAVIGVGSAVVSDVPAGSVAYGNPCRVRGDAE